MWLAYGPPSPSNTAPQITAEQHCNKNATHIRVRLLQRGLQLVLAFLREKGLRSMSVRRIAYATNVRGEHYLLTAIGVALSHLEELGFITKLNSGRPYKYGATLLLEWWLTNYHCLEREACKNCPLRGTHSCPFLIGYRGVKKQC